MTTAGAEAGRVRRGRAGGARHQAAARAGQHALPDRAFPPAALAGEWLNGGEHVW